MDIFRICKHYIPETTLLEVIECIYLSHQTDKKIGTLRCSGVSAIVHYRNPNGDTHNTCYSPSYRLTCGRLNLTQLDLYETFTKEFIEQSRKEREQKKIEAAYPGKLKSIISSLDKHFSENTEIVESLPSNGSEPYSLLLVDNIEKPITTIFDIVI